VALQFDALFASADDLVTAYDAELSRKGLLLRGATVAQVTPMAPCTVAIHISGDRLFELSGKVAAVVPNVGVAVMLDDVPADLVDLVARARTGALFGPPLLEGELVDEAPPPAEEEEPPEEARAGTVWERLKTLSVAQKISLALSCDRETRFALLRDRNKTLHGFVLRNPRIGLDEVQAAAKMASLSPDALKQIADHKEWGMNATICTSLVRNPKTMLPLALRLLDRVPLSEVRAIAKGGARDQIVQAARKRLGT
jgi:hypothetical protein